MVCVETMLVRKDLPKTSQKTFPEAKRDVSAISPAPKVKTCQESKNTT